MKFDLIIFLKKCILFSVKILAILMTIVIMIGVVDVGVTLYEKILLSPTFIPSISDVLATFGAFMAVLIAIEIFTNIILYLRSDIIHVKIVLATALMAVSRKVIIMDIEAMQPYHIFAISAVILAVGIAYWLIHKSDDEVNEKNNKHESL